MGSDRHMPSRRTGRTRQASSSCPGRPADTRPPRDLLQVFVTALPGLVAIIAVIFTWISINNTAKATTHQLQIADQGQVTDRFNVAVTNLGSTSEDIRPGGVYALRRVMEDSPRDQS